MSERDERDSEVHEKAAPAAPSDSPAAVPAGDGKLDLEPVGRNPRFVIRLVLALLVGLIAAAFVGMKLKGVAANCGAGLVRPGESVVPASESQPDAGR